MDVKTVSKNLITKGPKKTYKIYKERKDKSELEKIRKEISKTNKNLEKEIRQLKTRIDLQEDLIQSFFEESQSDLVKLEKEIYDLLKPTITANISKEEKKTIYEIVKGKEKTKGYGSYLKNKYIKKILPDTYNAYKNLPLENKVVFMERGEGISPSLGTMCKYMNEHTNYKVVKMSLHIRNVPDTLYYENAKEYVKEIATAKAVFICTANDLLGYINLRPETTYIQLWHGCGAFKKVGLSTMDKKFGKSAASHKEFPLNTGYSYVTIASPELSWIFEESMGIKKESGIIVPTGISRTDVFFDKKYIQNSYDKLHRIIPQSKEKKVILYAPTFRGEVATSTSPDVLDVKAFAEALSDEYILIFKHHQSAKIIPEIPDEYKDSFAFDMTRGKGMNINELMTVADICISDYSSVVFEYSLFERPMIFFTYDLEDYIDERGLYYDFDEITPGPMFTTNEEIIDYIQHIDERFDKQEVIDFKERFMCCCDGKSSERIAALIKE